MGIWQDAGGRWHVEFVRGGKRVHRRCPEGATAAQARDFEARLRAGLQQQSRVGAPPPASPPAAEPSLAAALQAHLEDLQHKRSYDSGRYHAYRLADFIQGRSVSAAPEVAAEFVKALRTSYATATLNRSLAALKRACSLAFKRGQIREDVGRRIELLPERNERHYYLTKAEIERLAKQDPGIKDAVRLAAYTGLRLGELLGLTPAHVVGGSIRLAADETKTGKARSVPIAAAIRAEVKRLPITVPRRELQKRFKAAAEAIGRPELHFHDLRHSTASLLINLDVDLYTVGAILGHSSPQTTARYAHLVEETKRKAIRKLG